MPTTIAEADTNDVLSTADTARELGLTPNRVRQLCSEGRLEYIDTPIGKLMPRSAVLKLRDERNLAAIYAYKMTPA